MRRRLGLSVSTIFVSITPALLATACGGSVESIGTTDMQLVPLTEVTRAVTACAPGAAHRNACCTRGPNTTSQCGLYPAAPFHPCEPDWTTYPDPSTCCDLTDPSHPCGAPPAQPPPLPSGQCTYGCPPGWYATSPITLTSGSCCESPSSGGGSSPMACFGWGPPGNATPSSTCDYICPAGWQSLTPSAADVCCRTLDAGVECFSQATGPVGGATTVSVPSSSPPQEPACAGGPGGGCSCSATTQGHSYAMTCSGSSSAQTCTCTVDGVTIATGTSLDCTSSSAASIWTNTCQFH